MESRAQRIMNLLKPPQHPRLDCTIEDDLSLTPENIVSNEEKENIPFEYTSPEKNTTGITQQQEIGFDGCYEIKRTSQHCAAPVGRDEVIENRNTMTALQKSITCRRSSSSSSSSSSNSSSSSSSTSSSTDSCDDHDTAQPLIENVNPQPSTSKANVSSPSILTPIYDELLSIRPRTVVHNYIISPIHSEESDVDLSDDDPTYNQVTHLRQRSWITATKTSIDINSLTTTVDDIPTKPRKRKGDPTKWMQNTQKIKRNLGQSYVAVQSKKLVPARNMKPPCTQKCRLKCSDQIDDSKRLEIFKTFWALGDRQLQRMYVLSNSTTITPKYKYTNAENPRNPNHAFYFSVHDERLRVCKTFFMNTLDISNKMIRNVLEESRKTGGFINDDQRGKHNNHKTASDELINDIINFINSIPRVESHYLRASTSREYISSGKSIAELFRDFEVLQKEKSRPAGLYHMFYDIFNKKFNLGFYQPKKDQCDLCLQFHNSSESEKQKLRDQYDTHLEEKELSREEKKNDRKNIDEYNICVCYDVQAIMQSPNGETSAFYYKSKLNSYNFTVTELKKIHEDNVSAMDISKSYGDVQCYFWDETQAKRGATEIGSCVLHYLQMESHKAGDREVNITFYSDNCCGQNKNKYLICLYLYAVANIKNVSSITHKYLIKGHTQNEADNVHSLIQKQIARDLKTGPIYSPVQYIAAIKRARKTGTPFKVHSLKHSFFYDLQQLQKNWGYNFNVDEQKNNVVWNSIKVLKFTKDDPFSFYYKCSYKDDLKKVNVRNKRKKMPNINEIAIQKAYLETLQLSSAKKNDLKDLINKQLIDPYYASYYNDMLS